MIPHLDPPFIVRTVRGLEDMTMSKVNTAPSLIKLSLHYSWHWVRPLAVLDQQMVLHFVYLNISDMKTCSLHICFSSLLISKNSFIDVSNSYCSDFVVRKKEHIPNL